MVAVVDGGHMTRREWMNAAGAAGVALGAFERLGAQSIDMGGGATIKLGIASYSFRKFSRAEAIDMTRQIGTPYLNVKDFHLKLDSTPEQIDAARREFADAGLILVGCGNVSFPDSDTDEQRRAKFEYAKRAGMPLIVCAPTHETLPKLEPLVKEYDIKLALHNHGPEDKHFPTPQSVLAAVKTMDPRCGLCMDIGHTARTGVDVVESIAEAGTRLLDMHVKDLKDMKVKESQCDVGEGKMPFPAIFRQLLKMNYQGYVNLEYEINESAPLTGMLKSFSYMRGVLAGIRG
jgi:sugar phosphate isomerase/epimerase